MTALEGLCEEVAAKVTSVDDKSFSASSYERHFLKPKRMLPNRCRPATMASANTHGEALSSTSMEVRFGQVDLVK